MKAKLLSVLFLSLCALSLPAQIPTWWDGEVGQPETAVIVDGATESNQAVAVIAQLKHVATRAKLHLDTELSLTQADWDAAFAPETNPFPLQNSGDGLKVLTQGQLKFIADAFYEVMEVKGGDVNYLLNRNVPVVGSWTDNRPWTSASGDESHLSAATLGQLKFAFSFDVLAWAQLDTDGDGVDDLSEIQGGDDPNDADDQVPAAPISLTGILVDLGAIDFNWFDAANNETGFRLEYRESATSTWISIPDSIAADATEHTYTSVQNIVHGLTYEFRLFATNAEGDSLPSEIVTVVTPSDFDNDGLPDSWEATHLGTLEFGPEIDLDLDGLSNEEEYSLGEDPNAPYVLSAVTADVPAGHVTDPLVTTVALTNPNPIGDIYYTLDGSEPNLGSNRYITPFDIPSTGLLRIKAVIIEPGAVTSPIVDFRYQRIGVSGSPISIYYNVATGSYQSNFVQSDTIVPVGNGWLMGSGFLADLLQSPKPIYYRVQGYINGSGVQQFRSVYGVYANPNDAPVGSHFMGSGILSSVDIMTPNKDSGSGAVKYYQIQVGPSTTTTIYSLGGTGNLLATLSNGWLHGVGSMEVDRSQPSQEIFSIQRTFGNTTTFFVSRSTAGATFSTSLGHGWTGSALGFTPDRSHDSQQVYRSTVTYPSGTTEVIYTYGSGEIAIDYGWLTSRTSFLPDVSLTSGPVYKTAANVFTREEIGTLVASNGWASGGSYIDENANNFLGDDDGDLVINGLETYYYMSNPNHRDSDGDIYNDGLEIILSDLYNDTQLGPILFSPWFGPGNPFSNLGMHFDLTIFNDSTVDTDGDGLSDFHEMTYNTDLTGANSILPGDTDGDGFSDLEEAALGHYGNDPNDYPGAPGSDEIQKVPLELLVGDPSGSRSEIWFLRVDRRLEGGSSEEMLVHHQHIRGTSRKATYLQFRSGEIYDFKLQHESSDRDPPDLDYEMQIGLPGTVFSVGDGIDENNPPASGNPGNGGRLLFLNADGTIMTAAEQNELFGFKGNVNFTEKEFSVVVDPVDMDASRVINNLEAGELSDLEEDSVGAFVPINNDDDDYSAEINLSSNNAITSIDYGEDKDQEGEVVDESDLLPIIIKPNALGGEYSISLPSLNHIRVWKNPNRTGEVLESETFNASEEIDLYVEGIGLGSDFLRINWQHEEHVFLDADRIKITTFEWIGPLNVPDKGTYTYSASGLVSSSATWVLRDSVIGDLSLMDANNAEIKWDLSGRSEGSSIPRVGNATYFINNNYQWNLEVNVIAILLPVGSGDLLDPDNNLATEAQGSEALGQIDWDSKQNFDAPFDANFPPGPDEPAILRTSKGEFSTMSARFRIKSVSGPTRAGKDHAGVKFVRIGFVQRGKWEKKRGIYLDPFNVASFTRKSSLENQSEYHIDKYTFTSPDTDLWLHNEIDGSYPGSHTIIIPSEDELLPAELLELEYDRADTLGHLIGYATSDVFVTSGLQLSRVGLKVNYNLYVCINTVDERNLSNESYFIRAEADWNFNANGTVRLSTDPNINGVYDRVTGDGAFFETGGGSTIFKLRSGDPLPPTNPSPLLLQEYDIELNPADTWHND